MAKSIQTSITINAPVEKIWQKLIDFSNYPNWNPLIISANGRAQKGEKLIIQVQPPNRQSMTFKPRVLVAEPNQELRWLGSGPIKGLFDGEHYFILEPLGPNTTKFVHGENFSGILVGLMPKLLRATKMGFENMNRALKEACEEN